MRNCANCGRQITGLGQDDGGDGDDSTYPTPQFPPFTGDTTMPVASASGSGNPTADAINAQWNAVNSVIAQCGGASQASPMAGVIGIIMQPATWASDYADWQYFYNYEVYGQGTATLDTLLSTFNDYQLLINDWGNQLRTNCPSLTTSAPANFPTGQGTFPAGAPGATELLGSAAAANTATNLLWWAGIVGLVGAGVWFAWPTLVNWTYSARAKLAK
jgi:hypothetical protein